MNRKVVDFLGFGFILWIIGFAISMIAWAFVPAAMIGWIVMPIMAVITIAVAFKRLKGNFNHYLGTGVAWLVIAVVLDFVFIVTAFNVQNYYDLDVMVYYVLTVLIPVSVYYTKRKRSSIKD